MRILGNSVDRKVAFVLGLAVKKFWHASQQLLQQYEDGDEDALRQLDLDSPAPLSGETPSIDEEDVSYSTLKVVGDHRDALLHLILREREMIRKGGFGGDQQDVQCLTMECSTMG